MTGSTYDRERAARSAHSVSSGAGRVNVLVMTGSRREQSYTRALGEAIRESLEGFGAATTTWDALEWPLPPADPSFHEDARSNPDPEVQPLVRAADAADGFALVSPVYHNSYSAALKNGLDSLGIAQFHYKPVVVASHGSRATHAVDHLRIVARGLLAVGLPTQICTVDSDYDPPSGGGYVLRGADALARVDRLAAELVAFAGAAAALRAQARS
jgi:azobenzene reductase